MAKQKKTKRGKVVSRSDAKKAFSSSSAADSNNSETSNVKGCKPTVTCGDKPISSDKRDLCAYCRSNSIKSDCHVSDLEDKDSVFQQLSIDNRRKSEVPWLISAYNCFTQNESSSKNEVTILALGIRQYMKEVFDSLDTRSNGYVSLKDIRLLCKVLGKSCVVDHDTSNSCLLSDLNRCEDPNCSVHIHFEKFFSLLGKCFSDIAPISDTNELCNSKLIDAVISISRRGNVLNHIKKSLENIGKETQKLQENPKEIAKKKKPKNKSTYSYSKNFFLLDKNKNVRNSEATETSFEHLKLQERILIQQQELHCLREIVEDLRLALQSSDAENLSLRVKLESTNDQLTETLSIFSKNSNQQVIHESTSNLCHHKDLRQESNFKDSIESFLELLSSASSSSEEIQVKQAEKEPQEEAANLKEECHEKDNMGSNLTKEIPQKINQYTKQIPLISNILNSNLEPKSKFSFTRKSPNLGTKDDILDDELQLQQAFERLYESQAALESTRMDLESTVLQIQEKDLKLKCLFKVVKSMKANLLISESKNFRLLRESEQMKIDYMNERENRRIAQKEKEKLKEEAEKRSHQVGKLQRRLDAVTICRNSDLAKLRMIRELLLHSLSTLRANGICSSSGASQMGWGGRSPHDAGGRDVTGGGGDAIQGSDLRGVLIGSGRHEGGPEGERGSPPPQSRTKSIAQREDLSSRFQRNFGVADEKHLPDLATFENLNGVEVQGNSRTNSHPKGDISHTFLPEEAQRSADKALYKQPCVTSQGRSGSYLDYSSLPNRNSPSKNGRLSEEIWEPNSSKRFLSDSQLIKEENSTSETLSDAPHSLTWDPSWSRKRINAAFMKEFEEEPNASEWRSSSSPQTNRKLFPAFTISSKQSEELTSSSRSILDGIEAEIDELRRTLDLECLRI